MFNSTIRHSGSRRGVLKNLQNSLLALASLFLFSCASPNESFNYSPASPIVVDNSSYLHYSHRTDSKINILLCSKAIDDKLFREIVIYRVRDDARQTINSHFFVHTIGVTGNHYLFHDDGSIGVPTFYIKDGKFNYGLFGQYYYANEGAATYEIEACAQSKTKSDVMLNNGCLIQAMNYQVNLQDEFKDNLAWTAILHVYYIENGIGMRYNGKPLIAGQIQEVRENPKNGQEVGHAYLVFTLKEGGFFAQDLIGRRKLKLATYDARTVGERLKNHVTDAHYDN